MKIEYQYIHEIIPYENNPRRNEEAIPFVNNFIERFGFQQPIVIDDKNIVICGHTRLLAAKELGFKQVPCVIADELTEEEMKSLAELKLEEFCFELPEFNKNHRLKTLNAYNLDLNLFNEEKASCNWGIPELDPVIISRID